MKNYLVLNGQKIELTPEQYKKVCNAVSLNEKPPFEKRGEDETYYYIDRDGLVCQDKEQGLCIDTLLYANANYCSNKKLMIKRANYEALERVLWRFSEAGGGAGFYSICYNKKVGDWKATKRAVDVLIPGPTFCSESVALCAIEVAKKWLSDNDLTPEKVFF